MGYFQQRQIAHFFLFSHVFPGHFFPGAFDIPCKKPGKPFIVQKQYHRIFVLFLCCITGERVHTKKAHFPIFNPLPSAHIFYPDSFPHGQFFHPFILLIGAFPVDGWKDKTSYGQPPDRVFFQQFYYPAAMIFIRMGNKNRLEMPHTHKLQIRKHLVFHYFLFCRTPPIDQIIPSIPAPDMDAVSLSYIQHRYLETISCPQQKNAKCRHNPLAFPEKWQFPAAAVSISRQSCYKHQI